MAKEFLSLTKNTLCPPNIIILMFYVENLGLLDYGVLKVNTNIPFFEGKISIGILIRNHLGIPILTKSCSP